MMVEGTLLLIMAAVIMRVMIVTTVEEGVFTPLHLMIVAALVVLTLIMKEYLEDVIEFTKSFRTFGPDRSRSRMQSEERFHFKSNLTT